MKQVLLKIVVVILAICFTIQLVTVLGFMFKSLHMPEKILRLHFLVGKIFLSFVLVHITLNWSWIKSQIFNIKSKKKA